MSYDPAWDMPYKPYPQHGSFSPPHTPPAVDPDSGDLVCLPPVNRHWLPFIQGCLDQMRNPSSWLVADNDAMYTTLARVDRLKQLFGQWGACSMFALRFTDTCELQSSVDGGETWTIVDGWDTNFPSCIPPQTQVRLNANCNLQESFDDGATWPNVPGWAANFRDCTRLEVGPPPPQPFPPTLPPADQACAIATHLVQAIIRGSMQQAVTSINATDSLITFGVALLGLVPGIDLVAAGVLGGGAALFEYINAGRISSFNTAVADDAYFDDMRCRVQAAIATTGYITPDNWPTVLAAVGSTPYSDGDVVFATAEFAASLGFSGANELQQIGTLTTGDCSECGTWCYKYDFTSSASGWTLYPGSASHGTYTVGVGWESVDTGSGYQEVAIGIDLPGVIDITAFSAWVNARTVDTVSRTLNIQNPYTVVNLGVHAGDGGTYNAEQSYSPVMFSADGLALIWRSVNGPSTIISSVELQGHGANPFGVDNCTY